MGSAWMSTLIRLSVCVEMGSSESHAKKVICLCLCFRSCLSDHRDRSYGTITQDALDLTVQDPVLYNITSCMSAWFHVPSRGSVSGDSLSTRVCLTETPWTLTPRQRSITMDTDPATVKSVWYTSYWNAFLLIFEFTKLN